MMKNVSLFIVLIGFLFFSCKKWQRNESHNDFTVEKLIVDTKQTECLDTNQYIIPKILSLKGSEGMILPQYDKIVFQNGKIYVMDKEITKNVVVFVHVWQLFNIQFERNTSLNHGLFLQIFQ